MRTEQEIRERLREIILEELDEDVKLRSYFIIRARAVHDTLLWVLGAE